ncbi:MAG: hypothetical protein AAGC67_07285 [Myxococcota bacterium]
MLKIRQSIESVSGARDGRIAVGLKAFACGAMLLAAYGAAAEDDADPSSPPLVVPGVPVGSGASGAPGLDALLSVPKGYLEPKGRVVGGADEDEWRRRFAQVHRKLEEAQDALAETKGALDTAADGSGSSQWAVAPPGASGGGGASAADSPLSFKLRQELLRNRESLEAAERALRELRIEADLAGVPVDWRDDRKVPLGKRLPDSPYYN